MSIIKKVFRTGSLASLGASAMLFYGVHKTTEVDAIVTEALETAKSPVQEELSQISLDLEKKKIELLLYGVGALALTGVSSFATSALARLEISNDAFGQPGKGKSFKNIYSPANLQAAKKRIESERKNTREL